MREKEISYTNSVQDGLCGGAQKFLTYSGNVAKAAALSCPNLQP